MRDDRVFVDTNIIIYAYTASVDWKHKIAMEMMKDLWKTGLGVLSTQVLQEFFVVVTKKIQNPLDIKSAKEIVTDLLTWNIIINDGASILKAIELHKNYRCSFWDAMIIEAAIRGRCTTLLSEDLSNRQIMNGITIKNPFSQS